MIERFTRSKIIIVILHISVWTVLLSLPFLFERPERLPQHSDIMPPHRIISKEKFRFERPENFSQHPNVMQQRIASKGNFRFAAIIFQLSLIPLFYLNAFFFVPKFLNRKKWGIYILLAIACVAGIIITNEIIKIFLFPETRMPSPIRMTIPFSIFILLASAVFSFVKENFEKEKERKEKEAENLKTELSFLRSQVNPHFLFNTLNNLVSLARKKSDLLEPSLLKLSGLLHYMLYESDDEKISIHKEIEYLDNYIELQKLRFGNDIKISFFKEAPLNSSIEVVPMILIPFVENAFKHGVVLIREPEIDIRLVLIGNLLTFNVVNKYNLGNEEKDKNSGIGLNNVKRRLNLLYPNNHKLEISQDNNWHTVNLSIIF